MSNLPELLFGTGAAASVATVWRFLRTETGRELLTKLRKFTGTEIAALKASIENLAQVVSTQGDSINWLRAELDLTRLELTVAKEALHNKESYLEDENNKLRGRVAELEAQVRALEFILSKKVVKKPTVKKVVKKPTVKKEVK